ncbi:hypothetical protein [uncultured Winogradskyella sp.]|uniref:hypothetical protein n=1 Tax=uncultured Winogradskyella sp. TaxID=395353 RepID=UPI00262959F7|nr:hypothetical protein [uncultured Winogradskyella sp.]
MAETSNPVSIGFILTTIATLWFFYQSSKSKNVLFTILTWMILVGLLGLIGFYQVKNTTPPRFIFLLGPGIVLVLIYSLTHRGRKFIDEQSLKWLTLLHAVRIPVEIILYYIFLEGYIPDLMTFKGYNYDIISGLSAPIMHYAVFVRHWVGKKGLLIWNFICLGLLINILTIAVLSAQTPLQRLAFNQPNIGATFFPYVWLPAVIVPIVLFSHLASIKQLLSLKNNGAIMSIYRTKRNQ